MTTTKGIKTHGTLIAISSGDSPESFTTLGECRIIPEVGGQAGLIDASNHDTTENMDYLVKDLADGSEISIEANYVADDAGQLAFKAAFDSKSQYYFQETLTNDDTFVFPGRITQWSVDAGALDDIVKRKFTIKITGAIVYTAA